jgi:CO/xanthine dehydrogenase FAD-binding subunit
VRRERWGFAFEEFAERHGDFAIVAVACALHLEPGGALSDLRLVLGGVDERPRAVAAQRWYGRVPGAADLDEIAAAAAADLDPPDDLRGSRAYRRALVRSQARRALARALAAARATPAGGA